MREHRAQHHHQKEQVRQAIETPDIVRLSQLASNCSGRAQIVAIINRIEHRQQHRQPNAPNRPAMFGDPPEWNSLQVAKKQWRVANRRETAAHVGDDEDKKNDVVRRETVFVHPQPGADQQHGRAGGPEKIGKYRADEQKDHVGQRRRFAFHIDVNAAGDDEQRADQNDEA